MNTERKDFDKEAASWDENPGRVKLAQDVGDAIVREIPLTLEMEAMDFGCGTGLLTLRLQLMVRSITGMDSSEGMLQMLKMKIAKRNLANVRTLRVDTDSGEILTGTCDIVVSNMTLHHIKEVRPLLDQFHKIIAPSGYLLIADLDPDGGLFHDNNDGVFHFGFEREKLRGEFAGAGFRDVRAVTAAEAIKPDSAGVTRRFTVFLMIGRK